MYLLQFTPDQAPNRYKSSNNATDLGGFTKLNSICSRQLNFYSSVTVFVVFLSTDF